MAEAIIEQVRADLFRAEIPLPRNPLKATNSYLIIGEERNLIIDTGMNRDECREAMMKSLNELNVDLARTDFFVTHLHTDHIGLVDVLLHEHATAYFNEPDAEIIGRENLWEMVCFLSAQHGFPVDEVDSAIDAHPGQRYSPENEVDYTMVSDGDVLRYGQFELHCVMTPGHTRGHTCLYDPHLKWFFSGDHILGDITPNISTWLIEANPLGEYFRSLDRVAGMDINLVLPGHRSLIKDHRNRIKELKEHHRHRLEEVLAIVKEHGPCSAFKTASHMSWDLVAEGWEDYPLMQKWFATGEALAHLRYLEVEEHLQREIIGEVMYFSVRTGGENNQ